MADEYKFTLDQCDVNNKQALGEYRTKRTEWLHWLDGDEHHAIWSQIMAMIWNDMTFALLNETRNPNHWKGGIVALNGMLINFIDQGYVVSQALAIRKLMDENKSKDPKKGVISLKRLVDDLKAHANLLTREIFVCHDGLPYDYQAVAQTWYAEQMAQDAFGSFGGWGETTGPKAFLPAELAHKAFDRISGVQPDNRQRSDRVGSAVFDTLDNWLTNSGAQEIIHLANKLIAHAADDTSRRAVRLDSLNMTISKVGKIHRVFVRCAQAVSVGILQGPNYVNVVPTPQYDLLEHLDQPFIQAETSKDLHDFRRKWVSERNQWVNGSVIDELCSQSATQSVP